MMLHDNYDKYVISLLIFFFFHFGFLILLSSRTQLDIIYCCIFSLEFYFISNVLLL